MTDLDRLADLIIVTGFSVGLWALSLISPAQPSRATVRN